jgi:hypothetical protein
LYWKSGRFCLLFKTGKQGRTADLSCSDAIGHARGTERDLLQARRIFLANHRIEVLNDLKYISFKRNEVKDKMPKNPVEPILADASREQTGTDQKGRTQRQTVALKNVHYRVYASI